MTLCQLNFNEYNWEINTENISEYKTVSKPGISEKMTLKTGAKSEGITRHVKSSRNVPGRVTTQAKALEVEIRHSETHVAEGPCVRVMGKKQFQQRMPLQC